MVIKKGDKIRVKRDISSKINKGEIGGTTNVLGRGLYFDEYSMEKYEGKEFEIEKISKDSLGQVKLAGVGWVWREDWLEEILQSELEGAVKLV